MQATDLVRKTKSKDAALILSNHYRAVGDYRSVIEFCLVADMKNEAFEVAQVGTIHTVAWPDVAHKFCQY